MTFNSNEYKIWYKDFPMLILWGIQKELLFIPRQYSEDDEFKKWDLTSKVYIFMKRLHQSYQTVMLMDSDERDTLFEMEMKLIKEEQKEKENINKQQ